MDAQALRPRACRGAGEGDGAGSTQLSFGGCLPGPRRALLRRSARKMEYARARPHGGRDPVASLVLVAEKGTRSCRGRGDPRGGRFAAGDRGRRTSVHDQPSLLRLVLRAIQGPRARGEDISGSLPTAHRIWGPGSARPREPGGDLARRAAPRLADPLRKLPPAVRTNGALRSLGRGQAGGHLLL